MTPSHSSMESKLEKKRTPDLESKNDATSEIIRLTRRRIGWIGEAKYAASYPSKEFFPSYWGVQSVVGERVKGGFGGILDGVLIVGNHKSVFQYNVENDRWIDVDRNKNKYRMEDRDGATGCKIGSCFLVYGERAELLQFKPWLTKLYDSFPNGSRDDEDDDSSEQIPEEAPSINTDPKNSAHEDTRPFWKKIVDNIVTFASPPASSSLIKRKTPIRFLRNQWFCNKPTRVDGHSLTTISYDKVLLIGGYNMFLGQLTWDKLNVRWKRLEHHSVLTRKSGYSRRHHIAFKMKDHVYVAGGLLTSTIEESRKTTSCEKYNFTKNKWSSCEHSLPYPLTDASVVVSWDESFAVITGGMRERNKKHKPTDGIIIFEEEKGFILLDDKMLRKRSNHVSVPIL